MKSKEETPAYLNISESFSWNSKFCSYSSSRRKTQALYDRLQLLFLETPYSI